MSFLIPRICSVQPCIRRRDRWAQPHSRHLLNPQRFHLSAFDGPQAAQNLLPLLHEQCYIPAYHRWRKLPRLPEQVGYVPTLLEVKSLLHTCRPDQFAGLRDYTLVMLAFDAGLRANELRTLTRGDVDDHDRVVRVCGKARPGKPSAVRYVPLSVAGLRALHAYLKVRGRIPGDVLFCNRHGQMLPRRAFCAIIERLRRRAHITTKLSWHSLRRAFTTEALRAGCPEEILRRMLGHKDLRMLARYTALQTSDLVRFHDATAPTRFLGD